MEELNEYMSCVVCCTYRLVEIPTSRDDLITCCVHVIYMNSIKLDLINTSHV